jgi:hypothetical protein
MSATSVKKMPCDHCFHETCILPWLRERNTCPVCRCQVESVCPQYNLSHRSELKGPLVPTPSPSPQDAFAGGEMQSESSAGHSISMQTRGDMIGLLRSAVIASRCPPLHSTFSSPLPLFSFFPPHTLSLFHTHTHTHTRTNTRTHTRTHCLHVPQCSFCILSLIHTMSILISFSIFHFLLFRHYARPLCGPANVCLLEM